MATSRRQHRSIVKRHAAAGRLIESGRQPQRRGLAAARGADDAQEFARIYIKADVFEDRLATERECHVGKRDLRSLGTEQSRPFARDSNRAHDFSFLPGG
jgi:hypothetical protein